jgi:hypothetical protein
MAQKFTVPVTIKNLSSAGSDGITVFLDQESFARLKVEAGGRITWGDGSGAGDTNLYRDSANLLKTDDAFQALSGVITLSTSGSPSAALSDGALAVDTANNVFYFRSSGVWNKVSVEISLDDLSDVSASAPSSGDFLKWNGTAWVNDAINLGTDTTGNYLVDVVGGTGVTVSHVAGEGSSASVSIGQSVATSASVTFAHVSADITGDLTGNADTATALETARTIELSGDVSGSASFDGTSNVNIFTTVNTASVAISELGGVTITEPLLEYQVIQYDGTTFRNEWPDTVSYVRNVDTVTLQPGTVVYIFGGNGDHATVKRADNSSDVTSSKTLGVVAVSTPVNENGQVVTKGYIDQINLTGYAEGDVIWLGKNGAFTKIKPSAPDHIVYVGVVVRATNNGIIYASCQNGYELEELHNVKINGVSDGQYLRYNSASAVWVADTINLGTDTAGDYVQSLVAGTGVTLSNNSGESATPTVAIGQNVATSASVTFAHLIVQGDMEVQGTITRLNETNLDIDEAFIYLNANSASANPDMGIAFNYNDGEYKHAGLFRDSSDGLFKVFDSYTLEPQTPIDTSHASYNDASIKAKRLILSQANGTAPISVSSSTVVENLNADKLDGRDSSYFAPIDSPTFTGTVTLPNNTVALGTQTTGNYISDISGGTGVNVAHTPGEGSMPNITIGQDVATSASVTFAAVTAPLIGNASTATTLQNPRTISLSGDLSGSVSFNGSSDVTISATVQPNSVALGTDTTGNYMSGISGGTGVTISHTPGEGSSASVSIGQDVSTSASVTFSNVTADLIGNVTGTISNISNHSIDELLDVSTTLAVNGDFLKFNGSSWVSASIPAINALDDIGDVVISSPTIGQILSYNGSIWINQDNSTAATDIDGGTTLADIYEAEITNRIEVVYDGGTL